MGSGSLNAMAVFEAGFKEDMTREEAMALVAAAIRRCAACGCVGGGGAHRCAPKRPKAPRRRWPDTAQTVGAPCGRVPTT